MVELGPGAADFGWEVGTRVAGTSHGACGFCRKCVEGRYNICENFGDLRVHKQYGHNVDGAYADYVVHSIKSVFAVPDALSDEEAAMLDPAAIALHTVKRGGHAPGDTVVVVGPGVMGLLVAEFAQATGAGRVIVVGRGARLEKAAALGHETLDFTAEDTVEGIRERTGGLGAEVALECSGDPAALGQCASLAAQGRPRRRHRHPDGERRDPAAAGGARRDRHRRRARGGGGDAARRSRSSPPAGSGSAS